MNIELTLSLISRITRVLVRVIRVLKVPVSVPATVDVEVHASAMEEGVSELNVFR